MGRFVLVDDEQVPVSPQDVAQAVQNSGFKETAAYYETSVSTIRNFLKRNGFVTQQTMTLVKEPVAGVDFHDLGNI